MPSLPSYTVQRSCIQSRLQKKMKVSMGTGGTWNENTMELQGDKRREVMKWLGMIGYQPILAGG